MSDGETNDEVEVPPAVVDALRNAVAVLRASWAEDDEAFAALVDGLDVLELRSLVGVMPFLVGFALGCPPTESRHWFAVALAQDVEALVARREGVA